MFNMNNKTILDFTRKTIREKLYGLKLNNILLFKNIFDHKKKYDTIYDIVETLDFNKLLDALNLIERTEVNLKETQDAYDHGWDAGYPSQALTLNFYHEEFEKEKYDLFQEGFLNANVHRYNEENKNE